MAETNKIVIEREYLVPLRAQWIKVPEYKRANKAVKALKEFIARHMKIYDRDLKKVRVDVLLNNEIRFRGMKKPPANLKVKAIKYEDGFVDVKLVVLPKHIEFKIARDAKKQVEKAKAQVEAPKEEKAEEKPETKDAKEKETSSKEATEKLEAEQAKQMKHTSKTSQETPKIQRKALKR